MVFRTEIETPSKQSLKISHGEGIVMLGSCFTDNIGQVLKQDGFDVTHNPMGPLYNPASICNAISLALIKTSRKYLNLRTDADGNVHCLDFATKYTDKSEQALLERLNADLDALADKILAAKTIILTLGSAFVFKADGRIVGNCHKFAANTFRRERMSVSEIEGALRSVISLLPERANIIFTVSPIRHTADGLHGNQLSKASLQLALDNLSDLAQVHYFPAYEIMIDDLRDYRFYSADMKHPSSVAVDYIYEIFTKYYFTQKTIERAKEARKEYLRLAHRPILS